MKVCWLSAGVSSFIAGYLACDVDKYIYIDIKEQHPDSLRFIHDCEKILGHTVEILRSPYESVENVIRKTRAINTPYGAPCTRILKKLVRQEWEQNHKEHLTYVWGFDNTEIKRAERLKNTMFEFDHEFPLIEHNMSKADAHYLLEQLGIKRPIMYDLGYSNNNCIGCVKGGKGYWNKIRIDFPEVFEKMSRLERELGHACINGVYLDELDPKAGRMSKEITPECGIGCEMLL